jgi:hypothetical protein
MQPLDVAAAISGLVGDLAKVGSEFDDVSVNLSTEATPTGTKSSFSYRAYRRQKP